jgi:hypothetical protein
MRISASVIYIAMDALKGSLCINGGDLFQTSRENREKVLDIFSGILASMKVEIDVEGSKENKELNNSGS